MRKTLIAAAMATATVLGVSALPLKTSTQSIGFEYYTQKCGVPPGGKANVCVTVTWFSYYFTSGERYVRATEVKYVNDARNGTAIFNPNTFLSYTVTGSTCVRPYVGVQKYGSVYVVPRGTRIIPRNTQFELVDRCPVFTTTVSIGGGKTLRLISRSSDPSI